MQDFAHTEAELIAWGLLEAGPPVAWSRRLRAAVMRAAAGLRHDEAAGHAPRGHPLAVAVAVALRHSFPERPLEKRHTDYLVAVEWVALPAPVLDLLGQGGGTEFR